ncbi:uracil-DNA glycosylase family protein [Verrucomicrobiota bacterium]
MTLQKILNDLEDYLEYKRDDGATSMEVDPQVVRNLSKPAPEQESEPAPAAEPAAATPAQASSLDNVAEQIAACTKCSLHETRTKAVPGQGSSSPEIMFIGEAPGADEDKQGLAFVGRAGQLLTKMIEAMGFTRDEVFIGNILKCRPPDNRTPIPDEMGTCMPYLKEQIRLLKPKVIIALGATAVKGLLDVRTGITKLRGTWMAFEGIDLMPTYHPAYLLRNPAAKKDVWEDLKEVLHFLGRPVPQTKK